MQDNVGEPSLPPTLPPSLPLPLSPPLYSSDHKTVGMAEVYSRRALLHFETVQQLMSSSSKDSMVDVFVHKHAEVRERVHTFKYTYMYMLSEY